MDPFAFGLYAVVLICWVPMRVDSSFHKADSNWRPLSVVTEVGIPNLEIQLLTKLFATVLASILAMGVASVHLVKESIIVSKYDFPSTVGSGPTMSTCTFSNRRDGGVQDPVGEIVCLVTFEVWHSKHVRAH